MPTIYSPLGKACAGMDLSAVHDILLKTGYKDDEGAENEVTNIQIYAASDLCHQFVMNFPHCSFHSDPCIIALLEERRNAVAHHLHLECEMCICDVFSWLCREVDLSYINCIMVCLKRQIILHG